MEEKERSVHISNNAKDAVTIAITLNSEMHDLMSPEQRIEFMKIIYRLGQIEGLSHIIEKEK